MSNSDDSPLPSKLATKWNVRHQHAQQHSSDNPIPASVLSEQVHLLPANGDALDLAAGRGGNARFLQERGFNTHAWDLSEVAMDELKCANPAIQTQVRDVIKSPPHSDTFDVITVSRFLDRSLCPSIEKALRPGGVLFYQTFTRGLSNPDFLLKPNELLRLFPNLHVQYFSDSTEGSESQLVAIRVS